ncbi:hypothetical protein [Thalassotalea aquiviva]|uniref:hypothetical protein n=1 Tax=Thalassotalea aquiviva TaxID=3242415 RepID=UPI00352AC9D8
MKSFIVVLIAMVLASLVSSYAYAGRYEVRKEIREGYREVNREKREAAIEVLRCKTRRCAAREIREGHREVAREKREARHEIRRAIRKDKYKDDRWRNERDLIGGIIVAGTIVKVVEVIAESDKDK